ncbi:MAG: LacI family DNA-binding transcriptional regulator [Planctomycetota bacterium]|jgi:DNA-binding LacI/PurR family transcriptional regulator
MPKPIKRKRGRPAGSQARYRRVASLLLDELTAGTLPAGEILPPLRVLQRKYGVGYRTVWLAVDALKRQGRVAPTQGRRLRVVPLAEGSASLRCPVLEVVSYSKLGPALENPIGWALHLGVGAGADEIEAPLLTVHGPSLRNSLPEGFGDASLRGVLLLGHFTRSVLGHYARTGLPTVLIDWPAPSWRGHAVYVDNDAAMRDAVARLLDMGHRHIAFIQRVSLRQGDLDLDAKERARSFRKALKEAGAPYRRESVFTVSYRDDRESPALSRLIRARPAFTAVITSDSGQAAKVVSASRELGRKVPRDLSVVSFQAEDSPDQPELSGPRVDFEAMGRQAVALLQKPLSRPVQLRFHARWCSGRTVAAPRNP